ncbi:MAG TPA: tetratricopeptide repeat protein [Candidatus Limnocylindria bacterium]|nr:tetratricopeptide repeat protein [Candidatus Limnocylindria bacterium]
MTGDTQLETLEAKGLIRLAVLSPELEYLFRHALVQDAAYGSLLKQERRGLHQQVGEALEALYPERRAELAAVLAMHFEQAGETDKAIAYLLAAGNFGLQRNAIAEAYAAFDRAAELLPPPDPTDPEAARRRRVEVLLGRSQTGYTFRPANEFFAELDALVPEVEALGDSKLATRVHMLIALGRLQAGESATEPPVKRSLDRIAEIGEATSDPSLRALPLALVGMGQVFSGSVRDGVEALEEAVPLLDGSHDSIGAAFARGALAIGYAVLGEFAKADEAARRATELAAKGDLVAQLDALIAESIVRSARGDLEGAVPLARECVERAEETGASGCVVASAWVLGDAYHRQGRYAEARDVLQRGTDISGVVDRKVWRPTLQAWLGSATVALGDADADDWEDALADARSIGNTQGQAGILAKRAETAVARGEIDAAASDFAASTKLLEALGARPALARALQGWGIAVRAAGRAAEAEPLLRRSLALFEELGLEREAGTVRTMLSLGDIKLVLD